MNFDFIVLSVIVLSAFVLFVGSWLRVDLVGLMVLSALALTGLITPAEAMGGFSSPAVVTVWALFILTGGLTRTGIAHQLGQPLQRLAHGSEVTLMMVLMVFASLLSALINTVTVAAILLPSTMELARRSGRPPSRLLMPLSLGCLLGGPFTSISTPPNILVTDALRDHGLEPFAIFDFTPITGAIVLAGIGFMVLIGRHLLPTRSGDAKGRHDKALGTSYQLDSHIFTTRIPKGSPLQGRTLSESRLGSALSLTVLAVRRKGVMIFAPGPDQLLEPEDILIVHGSPDHLQRIHASQHLQIESSDQIRDLSAHRLFTAEVIIHDKSPLSGVILADSGLRRDHRVHVRTLFTPDQKPVKDLRHHRLAPGDRLILQGEKPALDALSKKQMVSQLHFKTPDQGITSPDDPMDLLQVRVPEGSVLAGHDLIESRLGNAFGLTVAGIVRNSDTIWMPAPQEMIQAGDLLLLLGSFRDLEILEGLQDLNITKQSALLTEELESQQIGVTEVLLSPRTTLAGSSLASLMFRERYGISVLAVWRKGRAFRTGLQDLPLQFGDALLVYGQRRNLEALARDPDFLVLDESAAQAPRLEKARIAVVIMLAVILSAMLGLIPIAIAALAGATCMVLAGCLSMEEAYRTIEWKVVFLIAAMLPLGAAIENTGAAQMGASALVSMVGDLGPRWVVAALFFITVLGTQIIPTAALVVLMTPVALSTSATLGLSPHLLMMTVAISASSSFASPLSHPAHLLVMGPGGYQFMDYVKVGVPITVLSLAVSVALLPILWPPYP
ncbi:MAG: SLC13 family permease [Desulfotignum sp.]|nr:SLC13 family permease [Desulfotignum sp.]